MRLVFIMAYVMPEGFQPIEQGKMSKILSWMKVDENVRDCRFLLSSFFPEWSDDSGHGFAEKSYES